MSNKKLDALFREQLSDFRERPNDRVWSSIAAALDKAKKEKTKATKKKEPNKGLSRKNI